MSFLLLLLTVPALAAADPAMTALRGGAVGATTTPGGVAGISEQGVQTLLRDIEPALEAALGHMHIPDFRNKHIHLQNMRTQGFQCQPPCISANMGGGGSPFGGGGGNPFGGGAGGMPNIADIFSGMGGGGAGGSPFGGMGGGGMGGVQELLQKAMGNPKVMAAVQKAAGNPRVMAAVQDVMQNGPGAMKKYENDREVKAILDELRDIL